MRKVIETNRFYCRSWTESDLPLVLDLHQNSYVMRFFPGIATSDECRQFLLKMQGVFEEHSFAYLPVFKTDSDRFVGWVGLCNQTYLSEDFVDIGWRLLPEFWGQGIATEMASAFISYGFDHLKLDRIYAVAPKLNIPSVRLMERIGMKFESTFMHPKLSEDIFPDHSHLQLCVRYKISKP